MAPLSVSALAAIALTTTQRKRGRSLIHSALMIGGVGFPSAGGGHAVFLHDLFVRIGFTVRYRPPS
jgi:hypothetical protein